MTLAVDGAERSEEAVGKYRIISQLGQGGTADVYLAVAEGPSGFQKLVVLKVLKKSLGSDAEFRAMFLSEANLAARLHHPNIVQTNEVLENGSTPAIVMEYLDGQPLSQVIVRGKQGGLTLPMQIRILTDALRGLHAAHELADFDGIPLGVVHRDVSPHNVFVTVEGHAKVLDFGIAKLERSLVETEVGTIKGKLRYMAPEQIAGDKLDRRADIYSAGVMLWEALAGERMWKGLSESAIRSRVRAGDLPVAGAAPSAFDRICRRALSLLPAVRHRTALELADDLETALSEQGAQVSHRQIGAVVCHLFEDVRAQTREAIERKLGRTSMTRQSITTEYAATPIGTPRRTARRPAARVMIAAAGGVAIALAIWLVAASRHGSRPDPGPSTPTSPPLGRSGSRDAPPLPAGRLVRDATIVPASATSVGVAHRVEGGRSVIEPRSSRETNRNVGGPSSRRSPARTVPSAPPASTASTASAAESATPRVTTSGNVANAGSDCAHPFFVDGNGIKKYRPECM